MDLFCPLLQKAEVKRNFKANQKGSAWPGKSCRGTWEDQEKSGGKETCRVDKARSEALGSLGRGYIK